MNCTDLTINYSITIESNQDEQLNGTILFLIDNTGLFPNVSESNQLINAIISYQVITSVDDSDNAKFILFCGLTAIFIIIMIMAAAILHCKIKRIDKLIEEEKKTKK